MKMSSGNRAAIRSTGWLLLASALVVLALAGAGGLDNAAAAPPPAEPAFLAKGAVQAEPSAEVPDKVYEVLGEIQRLQGNPPPGYVGGRPFQNRERRLPRGQYREYDVNPKVPGQNRGPERLVIEKKSGRAYYTKDHYRSFVPVN